MKNKKAHTKTKKVYELIQIEFYLNENSRKSFHDTAIKKFLEEKEGYWENGVVYAKKYKYIVETLNDGRCIFLMRPTPLNKGMDFQVWVEKLRGIVDEKPSHEDIFQDLRLKRIENSLDFPKLLDAINKVYGCENVDDILLTLNLKYTSGFQIELLLKTLKWLFIEQDVTYWHLEGRHMLKRSIDNEFRGPVV